MTVTQWSCALMVHSVLHWPEAANLELWPYAIEHAVYLWNNLPKSGHWMSPIELFSKTKMPDNTQLNQAHVLGCPVYVLNPHLQDGKKIPKWKP